MGQKERGEQMGGNSKCWNLKGKRTKEDKKCNVYSLNVRKKYLSISLVFLSFSLSVFSSYLNINQSIRFPVKETYQRHNRNNKK